MYGFQPIRRAGVRGPAPGRPPSGRRRDRPERGTLGSAPTTLERHPQLHPRQVPTPMHRWMPSPKPSVVDLPVDQHLAGAFHLRRIPVRAGNDSRNPVLRLMSTPRQFMSSFTSRAIVTGRRTRAGTPPSRSAGVPARRPAARGRPASSPGATGTRRSRSTWCPPAGRSDQRHRSPRCGTDRSCCPFQLGVEQVAVRSSARVATLSDLCRSDEEFAAGRPAPPPRFTVSPPARSLPRNALGIAVSGTLMICDAFCGTPRRPLRTPAASRSARGRTPGCRARAWPPPSW